MRYKPHRGRGEGTHWLYTPHDEGVDAEGLYSLWHAACETGKCPVCGNPILVPPSLICMSESFQLPFMTVDCLHCGWFLAAVQEGAFPCTPGMWAPGRNASKKNTLSFS